MWFSKGLWKTASKIAFLTFYFVRLGQIWRGGGRLIEVGEGIIHYFLEDGEISFMELFGCLCQLKKVLKGIWLDS